MLREASQSERATQATQEAAQRTGEKIKTQSQFVTNWLTDQADSRGQEQKAKVAEQAHHVASSIRSAKDNLEDEQRQAVGRYADLAADRIDSFADYLNSRDVAELRRQAEDTVRRHPGLFLGAMFVGGLMVGRFLSSGQSGGSEQRSSQGQAQGRPQYGESTESFESELGGATGRAYGPEAEVPPEAQPRADIESTSPATPPIEPGEPGTKESGGPDVRAEETQPEAPYRRPEAPMTPPESESNEPETKEDRP